MIEAAAMTAALRRSLLVKLSFIEPPVVVGGTPPRSPSGTVGSLREPETLHRSAA
jgi:hypothetical protein